MLEALRLSTSTQSSSGQTFQWNLDVYDLKTTASNGNPLIQHKAIIFGTTSKSTGALGRSVISETYI
jgi:hypothetical protein